MNLARSASLANRLLGSAGSLRGQLARGGAGSLAIKAGYVVLHFTIGILFARILGPGGYGTYTFTIAVVALLLIPAQLGFPGLLVRMTAIYSDQQQNALLKGLLARSMQIAGLTSILIGGVAALLIAALDAGPLEIPTVPILVGLVLIPILALIALNSSVLRGLGHVVIGQIPEQILRPALLLTFVLLFNWHRPLTPKFAILANIAASTAVLGIGWWLLGQYKPRALELIQAKSNTSDWLRAAFPFLLLGGTQVINRHTDIIMLGILAGQKQVGLYRVAVQITDGLGMALMAVTAVITPHLARLHTKGDWPSLQRILVHSHRVGVAMLLPVALLLSVGAAPFLNVVFGQEYTSSAAALIILALGKALYAGVGFAGVALSMFGLASVASLVTGITATTNIGLNLILIPLMGIEGAALATVLSAFGVNAALAAWMYAHFGINVAATGRLPNNNCK